MAKIEIYTRDFCGFCMRAKSLLESKDVEFTEYNIGMQPELRSEMIDRSAGASTVPQVFINGNHVGGCDELIELERSGRLDPALAQPAQS